MEDKILCDHGLPLGKCCPCKLTISETELLRIENHLIRLFKSIAPQCEPAETVMGLYWQIDNYIAGTRTELTTLKTDLAEMITIKDSWVERYVELQRLLNEVMKKAVIEEWPDCGKPYWYCELCGGITEKGQGPDEIKHELDCVVLKIKKLEVK